MGNEVREFIARWQKAEGNEQREANSFWVELCQLLGIDQPTRSLSFERIVKGRRIDVFYEDMGILIENKSRGVDLDRRYERGKDEGGNARTVTPYEQAKWYADNLPRSASPRWVIVCNFDEIRIHDLNKENAETDFLTLHLSDLEREIHALSFFTDKTKSKLYIEKELSIDAGIIVGKLYDKLSEQYAHIETDPHEQHSLNVLIVRLIFLLYAEDAGLLQCHQAFYEYMKAIPAHLMRASLMELFRVLDTPEDQRDPYGNPELNRFPYINGGLFADDSITIPQFTEELRTVLLDNASCGFDWKGISPTIFGAVFESTLNPVTRRQGGMHYTSVENIHKVIDPLFLDDLKAELLRIEGKKLENTRKRELNQFWDKLATLKFLDPACGSGNFLTETYISLCNLELRVAQDIVGKNQTMLLSPAVNILQFYGIEINNFAVSVAKTALWIAEHQMFEKFVEIMPYYDADPLPLKNNDNIHCANALRMDWNDVVPSAECDYVIGNPPFVGKKERSSEQTKDLSIVFANKDNYGILDYVSGWYIKAAQFIKNTPITCALVSTNSITQGEQVPALWGELINSYKIHIDFARRTFKWESEAKHKAAVHCVIIGFSNDNKDGSENKANNKPKKLFYGNTETIAKNINPYLCDAPNIYVTSRDMPLCDVPAIVTGNQATDGGNFYLTEDERNEQIAKDPRIAEYIKMAYNSKGFINGQHQYCLWLVDADPSVIHDNSFIKERINKVREYRLASKKDVTREQAEIPTLFTENRQPQGNYIVIPKVSSENRKYIPMGFLDADTICNNTIKFVPNATLYHFGVLMSNVHNDWMRATAGRLEMRYQYSNKIVYNNFPWPSPTNAQKDKIIHTAQAILDARAKYPDCSLDELYKGEMTPELRKAHKQNDLAVMEAYGFKPKSKNDLVATLMQMYKKLADAQDTK